MGVPLTHPVVMDYHDLVRLSIETHGDLGYPHLKEPPNEHDWHTFWESNTGGLGMKRLAENHLSMHAWRDAGRLIYLQLFF